MRWVCMVTCSWGLDKMIEIDTLGQKLVKIDVFDVRACHGQCLRSRKRTKAAMLALLSIYLPGQVQGWISWK